MDRTRRLKKGDEFDTAYKEGIVVGGPFLVVRAVRNGLEVTRWGFAVGKRIAPHAVERNRTKRRMREIARVLPVQGGWDVIVVAKAPALEASREDLVAAIGRGLRKAGVLEEVSA